MVEVRPQHYADGPDDPYETIVILEKKLSSEEFQGFCKGNIEKYVQRLGKKEVPSKTLDEVALDDAIKIKTYARFLKDHLMRKIQNGSN
jgi:hypothetical protein